MADASTEVRVERLTEASEEAVADINALLPQLKPSWSAVGLTDLADLLSSPTRVYVARIGERIVGLTLMVPHRHFGGLRITSRTPSSARSTDGTVISVSAGPRDQPGP